LADAQLHYKEDANVLVDHGDRLFRAKVLLASGIFGWSSNTTF